MNTLKVYTMSGQEAGAVDVPPELIGVDRGQQAVHDVAVALMAGRRAGTASTLTKGEVSGSNRKPWRQKGTGRARAGFRQSPLWRGGGVVFGPRPRSYAKKVNRKVARLAFRRAFADRVAEGGVTVLDHLAMDEARTAVFARFMKQIGIRAPALFVVDRIEPGVARACRNIPSVEVAAAKDVNVYQLLRYPRLVVTRAGLDAIRARLSGASRGAAASAEVTA